MGQGNTRIPTFVHSWFRLHANKKPRRGDLAEVKTVPTSCDVVGRADRAGLVLPELSRLLV